MKTLTGVLVALIAGLTVGTVLLGTERRTPERSMGVASDSHSCTEHGDPERPRSGVKPDAKTHLTRAKMRPIRIPDVADLVEDPRYNPELVPLNPATETGLENLVEGHNDRLIGLLDDWKSIQMKALERQVASNTGERPRQIAYLPERTRITQQAAETAILQLTDEEREFLKALETEIFQARSRARDQIVEYFERITADGSAVK